MHLLLVILHYTLKVDLSDHLRLYLNNILLNHFLFLFNIHNFLAILVECLFNFLGVKFEIKDFLICISNLLFNFIEPYVMSVLQARHLPYQLLVLFILQLSQINMPLRQLRVLPFLQNEQSINYYN